MKTDEEYNMKMELRIVTINDKGEESIKYIEDIGKVLNNVATEIIKKATELMDTVNLEKSSGGNNDKPSMQ